MNYKSLRKELELIESDVSNFNLGERKETIEYSFKQLRLICNGQGESNFYHEAIKLKCQLIKQRNTLRVSGCEEDYLQKLTSSIEFMENACWNCFKTTLQVESLAHTIVHYSRLFVILIAMFALGVYMLIMK
ncbi:hypothetical protein ACPENL_003241 [Yersinia enterocolitica]|nr:hypothetical protein [Yersinia enterocolitica]HDL8219251.1 hypothetical protein [Yersinia enterocolitica]